MSRKITRRGFLVRGMAAGVAGALAPHVWPRRDSARANGRPPNFVLFMTDDQGYGDAGFMGHPIIQTPVLDEMAQHGLRLDRFYAAAPVCTPTRGSFLTGRHPNRYGAFQWGNAIRPQEVTMAKALKQAGYATGHFGKWHLGSVIADDPTTPGGMGFEEWVSAPNFYELDPWMSHNGEPVQLHGEGSMVTVEAALEFMEQAYEEDRPFLAVVWFGVPHTPHEATEELRALYSDEPENLQNYYGEITGVDRAVGRVREQLREWGIAENTMVLFTSDNGGREPEADNGELRGEKGQLWEGGIRVPAVIEWPGRLEPRTTDVAANTSDLYPTLLELTGAEPEVQPRPLDGISLVPLLEGRMDERPEPMGFWNYPASGQPMRSGAIVQEIKRARETGEEPDAPRGLLRAPDDDWSEAEERPGHAAWMDGPYKLHRIPNREPENRYELYNLVEDPAEEHNIIEDEPEHAERMKAALEEWQRSVVDSLKGADYEAVT
ncbi:MAG: sulfatase-like hydrolase/transferase [Candidatus Hydrogenedentota bacterium]